MDLQHLCIKIYNDEPEAPALASFVPIFHEWIRNKALPGLLIDVADYRHVPAGPGVLLIGHQANYSVEFGPEERFGLVYTAKQPGQGTNEEKLREAIAHAGNVATLLERDDRVAKQLKFSGEKIRVTFSRRSISDTAAFAEAKPLLKSVFDDLFGEDDYVLSYSNQDLRQRFSVDVERESDSEERGDFATATGEDVVLEPAGRSALAQQHLSIGLHNRDS